MKTHYRKAFNSPYLSSADLTAPIKVTIKEVKLEPDKTKKSKDFFNTAYFSEKEIRPGEELKPMVLNVSNSKVMSKICDSKFIDDWNNIVVQIYVEHNIKFGREVVDGLRISPARVEKTILTPADTKKWEAAKKAFLRDGNLDAVLKHVDMSEEHQQQIIAGTEDVPQ